MITLKEEKEEVKVLVKEELTLMEKLMLEHQENHVHAEKAFFISMINIKNNYFMCIIICISLV